MGEKKMTEEEIAEQRVRNFDALGDMVLKASELISEHTGHEFAAFIIVDSDGKVAVYQRTGGPALVRGLRELADRLDEEEKIGVPWQNVEESFAS